MTILDSRKIWWTKLTSIVMKKRNQKLELLPEINYFFISESITFWCNFWQIEFSVVALYYVQFNFSLSAFISFTRRASEVGVTESSIERVCIDRIYSVKSLLLKLKISLLLNSCERKSRFGSEWREISSQLTAFQYFSS